MTQHTEKQKILSPTQKKVVIGLACITAAAWAVVLTDITGDIMKESYSDDRNWEERLGPQKEGDDCVKVTGGKTPAQEVYLCPVQPRPDL